jgi:hypothetical protein
MDPAGCTVVYKNGTATTVTNTDPKKTTYYFASISGTPTVDTYTVSGWRGGCPTVVFLEDTPAGCAASASLSGTTLTVSFNNAGGVTAGSLVLERV